MRAIYGGGTYNQIVTSSPPVSTQHAYLISSSKLVSTSTTYTLPPSTTHTSTSTASLFTLPVIIAIIAGITIIILAVVIL